MKSLYPIAAALALALSSSGALAQATSLQCGINVLNTPQGVVLQSTARSGPAVSGSYQLSVETTGPAGRSTVSQAGEFSVRGGSSEALGSVSLGRSPGAFAVARMELSWVGGHRSCTRRIRL